MLYVKHSNNCIPLDKNLNDKITYIEDAINTLYGSFIYSFEVSSTNDFQSQSFVFHCASGFFINGVYVPQYSRGLYVSNIDSDAMMIALDEQLNIYVAYRNNSTWSCRKLVS